MPEVSVSIKGLEPALNRLRRLPDDLQKKALRSAMRKGANIVKAAAVAQAKSFDDPSTPKQVWKEITVRNNSKLGKRNGGLALQIGVKGGAKEYKDTSKNRRKGRVGESYEGPGKVFYWRFLEFGTSKMRARPFMRPALASNVDKVISTIAAALSKQLDKLRVPAGL